MNPETVDYEAVVLSTSQVRLLRSLQPLLKRTPSLLPHSNTFEHLDEQSLRISSWGTRDERSRPSEPSLECQLASALTLHNVLDAVLEVCLGQSFASTTNTEGNTLTSRVLRLMEEDAQRISSTAWTTSSPLVEQEDVIKKPSALHRFPPEVLGCILRYATWLSTRPEACISQVDSNTWLDHNWVPLPGIHVPMRPAQAQTWLLSLSAVCKTWTETVVPVALENIHLVNIMDIYKFNQIIESRPRLVDLLVNKATLSLRKPKPSKHEVPLASPPTQNWEADVVGGWGNGNGGAGGLDSSNDWGWQNNSSTWTVAATGTWAICNTQEATDPSWADPACPPEIAPIARCPAGPWDREDPVHMVIKFLRLAKNVKRLTLFTESLLECGLSNSSGQVSFMESDLLNTLAAAALVSLELDCMMLFIDLEKLLLATSSLRVLRLTGGLDNADERDLVVDYGHKNKLRQFMIINEKKRGKLGVLQLCWLLDPAVGYLTDLDLVLPASNINPPPWGGSGGGDTIQTQPFASGPFADLLVYLAPTLSTLRVEVTWCTPDGFVWHAEEPHNGNYSFALSHCKQLEFVSLPWSLAGIGFINALAGCSHLEEMAMGGLPLIAISDDLCNAIKNGMFEQLSDIRLRSFRVNSQAGYWGTRELRALRDLCKTWGINLIYECL